MKNYDVIIIGGGIIGSSTAYFLSAQEDFQGSIALIEPDPAHKNSSTGLSVGGIRQQFSTLLNIRISQFALQFLSRIDELLTVDGYNPEVKLTANGYLTLSTARGLDDLLHNYRIQSESGTHGRLLYQKELGEEFHFLNVNDLSAGIFGHSAEGWIDPYSLLKRFVNKAVENGVECIRNTVKGLDITGGKINSAILENGDNYTASIFVNACGPKAAGLVRMAGINDLPVQSRKRQVFVFRSHIDLPGCPLVVDPSGVYFRPEGKQFLCGMSPPGDQDPETDDANIDNSFFEDVIWPVLANRVPAFEAVRREHAWAGHYAYNTIDQNAIIGYHPKISNMLLANGFSGHGLQQAPAIGRGISELITYGKYKSLDLTEFSFERFENGELIIERLVV